MHAHCQAAVVAIAWSCKRFNPVTGSTTRSWKDLVVNQTRYGIVRRFHMRFEGKTALIAGAGRKIGEQIALAFARERADLVLIARTGDEVTQVAKECEDLGQLARLSDYQEDLC